MGSRKADKIEIVTDFGSFDKFERLSLTNDILGSAEATFSTGDDASWPDIERLLAHGTEVRVLLNGRTRLRGRAEVQEAELSPGGGLSAIITIRTKMADARYASARPRTVSNTTTFKEFLLSLYAEIGLTESDFEFNALADVALMTGKSAGGNVTDFEEAKPDQAKVNPPETIYAAADRHLRRFRALHWDGANGKIVVGRPDDTQAPIYVLRSKNDPYVQHGNNIGTVRRVRDWSEVAREVWLLGNSPGKDTAKLSIKGIAKDADVVDVATRTGHFTRLVLVPRQQAEDKTQADQQALMELSQRRQRKDGWELQLDGWSYWNGSEQIPYAPNTTADVDVDSLGGSHGTNLIMRTQLDYDTTAGATARLTCIAKGIFVL